MVANQMEVAKQNRKVLVAVKRRRILMRKIVARMMMKRMRKRMRKKRNQNLQSVSVAMGVAGHLL